MIEIDSSLGEGGGQIVRTSLALAMCTGSAIKLHNIRARRRNPGLRAQHLAAVRAAAAICGAHVTGATIASHELSFEPGSVRAGRYEIDVGTAGSTMLVFQTIFPPLSLCSAPSEVLLRGGTHNPRAPTFEFVRDAYLPLLERLGFKAQVGLERHGFFPRGGGVVRASIEPYRRGAPLELRERGPMRACTAHALLSGLPEHIGQREIGVLRERLGLSESSCGVETVTADGAGNTLHVRIDCTHITTLFAGFGMRGVPAENVANDVASEVEQYLNANVALDSHLADQVLLPLALAAGGCFSTLQPSTHTESNAAVIRNFLPLNYEASDLGSRRWVIALRPAGARLPPVTSRTRRPERPGDGV
jgi:RNA 3'-terminal phosphate cyclase (ATP)